jgi:hypothetical protein
MADLIKETLSEATISERMGLIAQLETKLVRVALSAEEQIGEVGDALVKRFTRRPRKASDAPKA